MSEEFIEEREDVVKRFKAFKSRSESGFSSLKDRIKNERLFLSGKQWVGMDKFVSKTRARRVINCIKSSTLSVANKYAQYPFAWKTEADDANARLKEFWAVDSNKFAVQDAVQQLVSFGLGVVAIGSDRDNQTGMEVPCVYSVTDMSRVFLDPDSTSRSYDDAVDTILVDYRSREYIRINYGEEYLPPEKARLVTTCATASNLIPISTYYYRSAEDGFVHIVTLVNDKVLEGSETVLRIGRLPVFPVFGEDCLDLDTEKPTYTGLVYRAEEVQRVINLAWTQLSERLSFSPKPSWLTTPEAVKNFDAGFKNQGSGGNPLLFYNRTDNTGKVELKPPQRLDNTIQFTDTLSIIQGSTDLLGVVTGVDARGLPDNGQQDITATQVNFVAKAFATNINHFMDNIKLMMKCLGDVMVALLGYPGLKVQVIQGPSEYEELIAARQQITALMQGVTDPAEKRKLTLALLKCYPNNTNLTELYREMSAQPEPNPALIQAQQLVQAQQQQILKLNEQIKTLEEQSRSLDKSYYMEFLKSKQNHEFKLEEMALQARLDQGADAVKAGAEAEKAQLSVQKEALSLERERIKTATTVADSLFGKGGF